MSGQVIEPAPNAPPPPPVIAVGEILAIGDLRFPISGVAFSVDYESSRKITKKVADGDDDATTVDGGREPRAITLKLSWKDTDAANKLAKPILLALDPSRKDTGNPPAWMHQRNGLDLGALKGVRNVVVEKAKGPNSAPGSGINTYEVTLGSQAKQTKGTAKTEKDGKKFVLGSELEPSQAGLPPGVHRERDPSAKPAPTKPGTPKP